MAAEPDPTPAASTAEGGTAQIPVVQPRGAHRILVRVILGVATATDASFADCSRAISPAAASLSIFPRVCCAARSGNCNAAVAKATDRLGETPPLDAVIRESLKELAR